MELIVDRLGKDYGKRVALQDVSFLSGPGLIGLVGPNGAGKTTLLRIMATLLPPTRGHVLWEGRDIAVHDEWLRRRLGYLPQDYGIYPELTGRQFLRYLAAMKGLPGRAGEARVADVLDLVHLTDVADLRLGTYSGGMKQRVGVAQALLNDPDLLIVDEPTAGLDPEERVRFRTLIRTLVADRVVIVSTHIISDLEAAADRVLLLHKGSLIANGTPGQLINAAEGWVWSLTARAADLTQLQRSYPLTAVQQSEGDVAVRMVTRQPPADAIAQTATLEEAYLAALQEKVTQPF